MICQTIFSNGVREWFIFGQDSRKPSSLIYTNQVLITEGLRGILVDPGGFEIFPTFLAEISKKVSIEHIEKIFFSHQDPDVVSSLPLWHHVTADGLTVLVSEIWADSLYQLDAESCISPIPDAGYEIPFGDNPALRAIPAHYLHSPGNFHLYDPAARILFTGKVGTAIVPSGQNNGLRIKNFIDHIDYMLAFHQRWMPSKEARDSWLQKVADIDIDTLVPQRGLIFQGEDVYRFLDWFSELHLASAIQTSYPERQFAKEAINGASSGQPEPGADYRLVTRSDFDGIVCAVLLEQIQMINDIIFVHPNDMQHGRVSISKNDIIANLPHVSGCHLSFDHHSSEISRLNKKDPNQIINSKAPSAARVVYEYYGGEDQFTGISTDLMDAVDKCDSGQFTMNDVLNPEGWPLLNFIMDPRTGLGRFHGFRFPNYELMMNLIEWCQEYSVNEILELPDVKERVQLYREQEKLFKEQIERRAEIIGNLIFLDYLDEEAVHVGNRFMIYAMFPQCNISIHQTWGHDRKKIVFSCGKSIFDRSAKTNVGELMLEYGGGGHVAAGTCQIEPSMAEKVKQALIQKITDDG